MGADDASNGPAVSPLALAVSADMRDGMTPPVVWDEISLVGLTERGFHGVFDYERRTGQEFTVDVVVYTDVRAAACGDELDKTINYADVAEIAADHIVGPPVQLIETLAEQIAQDILAAPGAAGVQVTVHKPKAPIAREFSDVSVKITRWAGQAADSNE